MNKEVTGKYFEGINFTPLVRESFLTPEIVGSARARSSEDIPKRDYDEAVVYEARWSRKRVIADYRDTIGAISGITGANLPLDDRAVFFVPRMKLIPENLEAQQEMVERYGTYILDSTIGDCTRIPLEQNPSHRFRLRIGVAKSKSSHLNVLEYLSHEYGHTLGYSIDDPVFEEMKADAFMALFMRFYWDTDQYLLDGENPDRVHDVARHNIRLLQARGICEEETIAHLTERPFGKYDPYDYKQHIGAPFVGNQLIV